MNFVLTPILILAAVIAAPNAEAQNSQLNSLAVQMAQAISESRQDSVIVIDFFGPNVKKLNALNQNFAQDFSESLAKANPSLHVLDRAKISKRCAEHSLSLSALSDPSLAVWIARDLGAKTLVLGRLAVVDNTLNVAISAYRVGDGKSTESLKTTLPLSGEMQALIDKEIPDISSPSTKPIHMVGEVGLGYPKCKQCPLAQYSEDAIEQKTEGTVILLAIVGTDGRAHNISVMKGMSSGLTRQAVIAVSRWTFAPALDRHGKPAAFRQVIEVTFHLH